MKNNDFEEDRTRRAEKKDNKSTQEEPKMVPWLPRSSQETPKSTPEKPRRPPRDPQERPKEAQESPKTLSRPSSDRKRRFFRNRAPAEAKSWFLRVRGSAWEVKIDPKRVEKEYKHVLEEDMSQRRCQESRKKLRRSPKVTIHWPCQYIMSILGRARGGVLALACGMRGACVPPNFPLPLAFLPI